MFGVKVHEDDVNRILSNDERKRFRRNFVVLTEKLDPDPCLVRGLVAIECISSRHQVEISAKSSFIAKNEELLGIMQRRSYADFSRFIHYLNQPENGQMHVAQMLLEDGGYYFLLYS